LTKRILITGAGSGFGRDASFALAARGHDVIASTETETQAERLRKEHQNITVEKLDITSADVAKAESWEIDVLINNAGVAQTGPLADIPIDLVRGTFEVNVFGTLNLTQRVLPGMVRRGNGRVIIVSSIAGVRGAAGFGPYSMTKHSLEAMGKILRKELLPLGVDVAILNPGPYATGFNDRMVKTMWEWYDESATTAAVSEMYDWMRGPVDAGQMDPREVVEAMVELVEARSTPENTFVPIDIIDQLEANET